MLSEEAEAHRYVSALFMPELLLTLIYHLLGIIEGLNAYRGLLD